VLLASPASAHPLGNFTVNAAAAVVVTPGQLRIDYALDLAEIPTFQLRDQIDPDGDGVGAAELDAWAARRAGELARGLELTVEGRSLELDVTSSTAVLLPGQGGLDVLRLDAVLVAPAVPASGEVLIKDRNDRGRLGWREMTAAGGSGAAVRGSTVPAASPSSGLRSYPEDLLASPPSVRTASFVFVPSASAAAAPVGATGPGQDAGGSRLSSLIAARELSPGIVVLALAVALGVGALHALAPGHGKTITAAYLAGSSAGVRQTLGVAIAVAAMHTASVLVVGLALVAVQSAFPAERIYPWLGAAAGAAALALGVALMTRQLRHRRAHHNGHGHEHVQQRRDVGRPSLAALAMSGGLLPSPTAVVVLLGAFTLGRAVFGLALVVAFGLGLAGSLALVGLVATRARRFIDRRLSTRVAAMVPMGSAAAIAGMGVVLTARAVSQL
jgi:ABC-type nickel/cobalt efflux system permease component RcnA